ncbi:hypothetical protein ACH5RR_012852 [Cinchona calisaya]|uniref:Endonuclease/exonuclease/phosphatase domain-containing protein n=1 Tax=Cinchona calisaya TaxID=153742 RepID=A0ABD3A8R3_9GENT
MYSASVIENVKNKLGFHDIGVHSKGNSGGLALLWKKHVNVVVQGYSQCCIDSSIQLEPSKPMWHFTGYYGDLDSAKSKDSWHYLKNLAARLKRPWLCAGDFNEVLRPEEVDGASQHPNWQIQDFRSVQESCGLSKLIFLGNPFTWMCYRKRHGVSRANLNRALAGAEWLSLLPTAKVYNFWSVSYDHRPIKIQLESAGARDDRGKLLTEIHRGTRHRKEKIHFETMWSKVTECENVIRHVWDAHKHSNGEGGKLAKQNRGMQERVVAVEPCNIWEHKETIR